MSRIVLDYPPFSGYTLEELPDTEILKLMEKFPLEVKRNNLTNAVAMFVTIAVHEEHARRKKQGKPSKHRPSKRQFAVDIITKGYRALSQSTHPDREGGDTLCQQRLNDARDELQRFAQKLTEERSTGDIIVTQDITFQWDPNGFPDIASDDDVPF